MGIGYSQAMALSKSEQTEPAGKGLRWDDMTNRNVVLLGDSVFDNGVYVEGGPDVRRQLAGVLPDPWSATRLAVDGDRIAEVRHQIGAIPPDASHLVLSVGGNDALGRIDVLDERVRTVGEALLKLHALGMDFRRKYAELLDRLLERGLPLAVCSIYDPSFPDEELQPQAVAALCVYNDAITREAAIRKIPLIDLRVIFNDPDDYANPIEPSCQGGMKLARAISRFVLEAGAGGGADGRPNSLPQHSPALVPLEAQPETPGFRIPRDLYFMIDSPAPLAGMPYPHALTASHWVTLGKTFQHVVNLCEDESPHECAPLNPLHAVKLQDLVSGGAPNNPKREAAKILRAADVIVAALRRGEGVVVHCMGGRGRTGTVLGCALRRLGHGADEVVAQLDAVHKARGRRDWPEADWQEQLVRDCGPEGGSLLA